MSLSPNNISLLKSVPLFAGLPSDVLVRHLERANLFTLAAGKVLLAPGDVNENIYIILSGRLRVNADTSDDDPIAMFGEGESVGEMSVLNSSKALDYVFADTDCELLSIDLATIWSLVKSSHRAALNMLDILSTPSLMVKRSNQNVELEHGYAGLGRVDELTGLYNTSWLFRIFERQLRRLPITHDRSTLMLVSIDHFDRYNQSHGLLGGDQALRTMAQSVMMCLRPEDHVGRFYGPVIAAFMAHTTLEQANSVGQRLLMRASQAEVVTPSGDVLPHFTISIGISQIQEGNTVQELFDRTAEVLRQAKDAGGNCIKN